MNTVLEPIVCISPPTFPAYPINGGPLPVARPKRGAWYYEPKYNGWRALVHVPSGSMFNHDGKPLTITREFHTALESLREIGGYEWLDCEALERRHNLGRGALVVFDCPDWHALPFHERRRTLEQDFPVLPIDSRPQPDSLFLPVSLPLQDEVPLMFYQSLKRVNALFGCEFYEGVVAKESNSKYPIQLRSPKEPFAGWMKHRWPY